MQVWRLYYDLKRGFGMYQYIFFTGQIHKLLHISLASKISTESVWRLEAVSSTVPIDKILSVKNVLDWMCHFAAPRILISL